jgi:hypothetical protein
VEHHWKLPATTMHRYRGLACNIFEHRFALKKGSILPPFGQKKRTTLNFFPRRFFLRGSRASFPVGERKFLRTFLAVLWSLDRLGQRTRVRSRVNMGPENDPSALRHRNLEHHRDVDDSAVDVPGQIPPEEYELTRHQQQAPSVADEDNSGGSSQEQPSSGSLPAEPQIAQHSLGVTGPTWSLLRRVLVLYLLFTGIGLATDRLLGDVVEGTEGEEIAPVVVDTSNLTWVQLGQQLMLECGAAWPETHRFKVIKNGGQVFVDTTAEDKIRWKILKTPGVLKFDPGTVGRLLVGEWPLFFVEDARNKRISRNVELSFERAGTSLFGVIYTDGSIETILPLFSDDKRYMNATQFRAVWEKAAMDLENNHMPPVKVVVEIVLVMTMGAIFLCSVAILAFMAGILLQLLPVAVLTSVIWFAFDCVCRSNWSVSLKDRLGHTLLLAAIVLISFDFPLYTAWWMETLEAAAL